MSNQLSSAIAQLQAENQALIKERYGLRSENEMMTREIEDVLVPHNLELFEALKAMRREFGRTQPCTRPGCIACTHEISATRMADEALRVRHVRKVADEAIGKQGKA